ncbi:MAG: trypsin-like peptidase domain-containing protein [Deltaproteobacteria bacterium]|nr:trypsin-like peptidase domain-containing protein [Deltaproteobacteria bacterium]
MSDLRTKPREVFAARLVAWVALTAVGVSSGCGLSPADTTSSAPNGKGVVYGDDNRKESVANAHAKATALVLAKDTIVDGILVPEQDQPSILLWRASLRYGSEICEDVRFAWQPARGWGTAFLIKKNIAVTAAHVLRHRVDSFEAGCAQIALVFDYRYDSPPDPYEKYDRQALDAPNLLNVRRQVRHCKRVIYAGDTPPGTVDDFAIIELDRAMTGRALNISDDPADPGTALTMIGHPNGLPAKVTTGVVLERETVPGMFLASLDAFSGNSGSAVVRRGTAEVVGILVDGEIDYRPRAGEDCLEPHVCANDGSNCRGEVLIKASILADKLRELGLD